MVSFSKITACFGSKKDSTKLKNEENSRVVVQMMSGHNSNLNKSEITAVRKPITTHGGNVRARKPINSRHPAGRKWPEDANHGYNDAPLHFGASTARQIEYADYQRESDRYALTEIQDVRILPEYNSGPSRKQSDTLAGFGFFAPREGEYQAGHVEEIDNFELKRSNAFRARTWTTDTRLHSTLAEETTPTPTARPFSWMVPGDVLLPSLEGNMSCAQEDESFRASDSEIETIGSESQQYPYRIGTMRKVALARLEGRR